MLVAFMVFVAAYQVPRRRGGDLGQPAGDWSDNTIAWWDCEDSGDLGAQAGGSCGTDCDLTNYNTVTQDTTNYREGAASCSFDADANEYLSCVGATCEELKLDTLSGDKDWIVGGWYWVDLSHANANHKTWLMIQGGPWEGYYMEVRKSTTQIIGWVGDGAVPPGTWSGSTSWPDDQWRHAIQTFDDGTDGGEVYENGSDVGGGSQEDTDGSEGPFFISYSGTGSDLEGKADEIFVMENVTLSAAEACYIPSCGLAGQFCTCRTLDGTKYLGCAVDADCRQCATCSASAVCDTTNGTCSGYNNTRAGGCTLSDCNQASP
jgi:hypothetical protein